MLSKLCLKNYKAFEGESFEVKPITVILGPNNSGKSSVLSAARVLSQTITSYDISVPFLLNGGLGNFGTYKDVVYGNSKRKHIEISFSIKPDESGQFHPGRSSSWEWGSELSITIKFKLRPALREIVINELKVFKGGQSVISFKYSSDSDKILINSVNGEAVPISLKAELSGELRFFHFLPRSASFPPRSMIKDTVLGDFLTEDKYETIRAISRLCDPAYRFFSTLEYIGAMRQPPSTSYLFSGERHAKVGASGENAANIIAMDSFRRGKKSKNIRYKVVEWLKSSQMASDIRVDNLSDSHYELHIQNPNSNEYQNFADVGYGISQVVPVLVAGYNLMPEQTLMVEEPEIHLHPNAQAQLGDFFLDLYKHNVQSIIESHSEYLVVRLQQHVASGLLDSNDIAFYYIHADGDGKKVAKLSLDSTGTFKQPWPQGFFPHRLEEAKKLAKLRASSLGV